MNLRDYWKVIPFPFSVTLPVSSMMKDLRWLLRVLPISLTQLSSTATLSIKSSGILFSKVF